MDVENKDLQPQNCYKKNNPHEGWMWGTRIYNPKLLQEGRLRQRIARESQLVNSKNAVPWQEQERPCLHTHLFYLIFIYFGWYVLCVL